MRNAFLYSPILSLLFISVVSAADPEYSSMTKELLIPVVNVDNTTSYSVKMTLANNSEQLLFSLDEAVVLPAFEDRFVNVENGMTRQAVVDLLGMPGKIKNLQITTSPFCDQPSLNLGSYYEQWEYNVDPTLQAPSGFVVWFASVDGSSEWSVVGKIKGYACI